jgi:hypothetical protein
MRIKLDYGEIELDEAALAHHVAAGNIPAEIAEKWLDRDWLNKALSQQMEKLDIFGDWYEH